MDDERLDDRVADEIRTRLMREVADERRSRARARAGRSAPARSGRRAWIPVLATIAVAVVVLAASIAVLVTVRPPQVAAPRLRDARMFDGSCGSVLTSAEAERAIGEAVLRPVDTTRADAGVSDSGVTALFALGGLRCDWGTGRSVRDQAGLVLAAAPIALAPKRIAAPYCYGSSAGGPVQTTCTFDRRSGSVWFSGLLTTATGGKAVVLRRLATLGAALDATAKQPGAAVPLPARAKGSWARGTDCTALARSADLATVLRTPDLVGEPGNGGAEQPQAQLSARTRLGATLCLLDSSGTKGWRIVGVEVAVFPGAASVRNLVELDPSAKTYRLASGRRVVVTTSKDGPTVIHAFDGQNYLQLNTNLRPLSRVLLAVDPLLRRLDAGTAVATTTP